MDSQVNGPRARNQWCPKFSKDLLCMECPLAPPGIVGRQDEDRKHRLPDRVAQRDRHVERGIVNSPLCSLHPVNDTLSLGIGRARTQHTDARMGCQQAGESLVVRGYPPLAGVILQEQVQLGPKQDIPSFPELSILERDFEAAHQASPLRIFNCSSKLMSLVKARISSSPTARTSGPCGVSQ